ncbi:uncharacterized protein N7473_011073 [Penicillium subrubescens]|uniref:uncharacterized protein n=1 Tax=Penicillium subrubescens TaxID=1316194 RepID=UPI002545486F|nr:uncharacterized protein N7473_011073 [Penicillium subrubescens]KAJ5882811.1 hypothetical protein N7473_011073 [Penicillium subrubescens]
MAENHPTVRLISLGTMLRTIDRELSDSNCQEAIPLPIAQALHDMSVVAASNDAASDWQEHEIPWLRLVQGLLENVQCRGTEINRQARKDIVSLRDRHRQFWNSIDDCMLLWSNHNPIVPMVLNQAPVPRASVESSTLWEASWDSPDASPMPTATQKRKSRKWPGSSNGNAEAALG